MDDVFGKHKVDNRHVEGRNHPINPTDDAGNTYQRQRLPEGSTYEIRKNFPTATDLRAAAGRHGTGASIIELEYCWLLTFTT